MLDTARLKSQQARLATQVVLKDKVKRPKLVGGADQAFLDDRIVSAIVVCGSKMQPTEKVHSVQKAGLPYIPGLLAYREGPAILAAWKKLQLKPDMLLIDGQGIAHPRRAGLACYVGVKLGIPTIGVAKSRLCGEHQEPKRGRASKLFLEGRQVGWVLKPGTGASLFISPGHLVSVKGSLRIVQECFRDHRLPEPLRLAHLYSGSTKREYANHKVRGDEG